MPEVAGLTRHAIKLVLAAIACAGCGSAQPAATQSAAPRVDHVATLDDLLGDWRPVPYQLTPAVLAAVDRACRESIGQDMVAGARIAVADARGEGVIQLWYEAPEGWTGSCIDTELRADGTFRFPGSYGSGGSGNVGRILQPTELVLVDRSEVSHGPNMTRSYVGGRFGPAIVRVQIQRPGLVPVEASVGNGWFGAWVEGKFGPGTVVRGLNGKGVQLQLIEVPAWPAR